MIQLAFAKDAEIGGGAVAEAATSASSGDPFSDCSFLFDLGPFLGSRCLAV